MNSEVMSFKESEKLRLFVRDMFRDNREEYIKHKKFNEEWKARKKITRKAHYERNKEFIVIQRRLKKILGIAPGINEIKKDKQEFEKMLEELKCLS